MASNYRIELRKKPDGSMALIDSQGYEFHPDPIVMEEYKANENVPIVDEQENKQLRASAAQRLKDILASGDFARPAIDKSGQVVEAMGEEPGMQSLGRDPLTNGRGEPAEPILDEKGSVLPQFQPNQQNLVALLKKRALGRLGGNKVFVNKEGHYAIGGGQENNRELLPEEYSALLGADNDMPLTNASLEEEIRPEAKLRLANLKKLMKGYKPEPVVKMQMGKPEFLSSNMVAEDDG